MHQWKLQHEVLDVVASQVASEHLILFPLNCSKKIAKVANVDNYSLTRKDKKLSYIVMRKDI
jgi:ABC-type uncharacterized transport system substrate-binding protein